MVWILLLSGTDLSTHALTPGLLPLPIRSLSGLDRRHLNAFRGVRAISEFDWPFTPTHSSSRSFSTLIRADLHSVLPELHPGHV